MSEFLGEARIVVRPDTTRFRAELQEQVARAVSQTTVPPLQIPVAVGGTLGAVTAQTAALAAAQQTTAQSTLGLASAAQVENTAFGRQAVILETVTAATAQKAGADAVASGAARTHAAQIGQVEKAALASSAGMLGLRGAVLTAGTAFLGATIGIQAFGKAVQSAIGFERELNVFRVTVGATADEMQRASDNARQLGADLELPGVTAQDAATAQLQLARAGLSVQDAIDGARGSLQLATAAQIDFGNAADLVAGNLNAFGLAGSEAVRVADLLTGAANESQGSIEDMGIGLRQVAGAASLLGLTVEDTVALLTQLTKAGLAGSDAGTTLRVALVRLARPDVRQEVERLVGSLEDLQGNLDARKIVKLAEEIQKSGGKLDQTNKLYELFGENALRVIGLLGQEGVAGFDANTAAVTETGLAAEQAGARMAGLGGDIENLSNQASAAGLTLGQLSSPVISTLARGAADLFRGFNFATEGIRKLITASSAGAGSLSDLRDNLAEAQQQLEFQRQSGASADIIEHFAAKVDEAAEALDNLRKFTIAAGQDLDGFGLVAAGVTTSIGGLVDALNQAGEDLQRAQADPAQGLNVQGILNRVTGLDAEEVRARISGDTQELLSVLEEQQAFLQSQLERQFVRNRPGLQRQLEQALLGTVNDIASIQQQGAAATKAAAQNAARAQQEADQALLETLSTRRSDAERKAARAGQTAGLSDDIRAQDRIQALIKIQITKIRTQVKDEETRKNAIRELRLALIASRAEEDRLRAQRAQEATARKDEIQNLNIAIAEERGNKSAIERAINARINTLNKQIKAAKGDQVKMKQLILERERLKNQLEELNKQQEDAAKQGKTFAQSAFEFAQSLQGFSANLLGNLIPGFATGGLVGGSQPAAQQVPADIGAGVRQAGVLQAAETRGVRPVQVDTTNALLRQILAALQGRQTQPPEIRRNRRTGSAMFDTL